MRAPARTRSSSSPRSPIPQPTSRRPHLRARNRQQRRRRASSAPARDRRASGSPSARPRRSIPPPQFRNSFSYVPNAYVAGGRTTVARDRPDLQARPMPALGGGGRRRYLATKNALNGQPNWDFVSGSFGINAVSSITLDPERPVWRHGSGSARARRTPPATRRPASASTSRPTAATRGRARSARASSTARAVGSIAVDPGEPEHDLRGVDARCSRHLVGLRGGGVSIIPGRAASGASTSRPTAVRPGRSSTTARRPAACAPATRREATNRTPCSPRGVRRVVLDPLNSEHRLRGLVRPRRLAVHRRRRDVDADPRRAHRSTPAVTTARPEIAVTRCRTATRACTSPRARRARRRRGSSARTTSQTARRVFTRPDELEPGRPAVRDVQRTAPGSAGTTTSSTRPRAIPDVVYVGGSYSYSETGSISNGRAVVLSTGRRRRR